LTLAGTNLGSGTAVITIDNIPCTNPQSNSTIITCTVGPRPNIPNSNSFSVVVGGTYALVNQNFLYGLAWSDASTWGTDLPPIDGDLVYVPQGLTLVVDVDTPQLEGIVVDGGTLLFSDQADIVVQATQITLNGGAFIAGT
jgi:hypothetical protein